MIPQALRERLRNGTVIPFVGAGVPMAVRRADGSTLFPSWRELLLRGADRLHEEGKRRDGDLVRMLVQVDDADYLEAARRLANGLGPLWPEFLQKQIDIPRDAADDGSLALARSVWALGSQLLVTTNYDRVLEWTCPSDRRDDLDVWDITATADQSLFLRHGAVRTPTVWHLHGRIRNVANLILTPDGFERLYSAEPDSSKSYQAALTTLRNLLLIRSLLFVGFSFQDEHFGIELKAVVDVFGGIAGPHYALVRSKDADRLRHQGLPVELVVFEEFGEPHLELVKELGRCSGQGQKVLAQTTPPVSSSTDQRDDGPFLGQDHKYYVPQVPAQYTRDPYTLLRTEMIGRETEKRELTNWLESDDSPAEKRIFVIQGATGGTGKSALAWSWFKEQRSSTHLAGSMWWNFSAGDADFHSFVVQALSYIKRYKREEIRAHIPKERVERLLTALEEDRFLIALDGMEWILQAYAEANRPEPQQSELPFSEKNYESDATSEILAPPLEHHHSLRTTRDPLAHTFLERIRASRHFKSRLLICTRIFPLVLEAPGGGPAPHTTLRSLPGLRDEDAIKLWRVYMDGAGLSAQVRRAEVLSVTKRYSNHPLFIERLASAVVDFPPAPGNISEYMRHYQNRDLGFSHLIEDTGIGPSERRVLSIVSAFLTPLSYRSIASILREQHIHQLHETLRRLVDIGLLGWDRKKNRYNIHPVIGDTIWRKSSRNDTLNQAVELFNLLIESSLYDDAYTLFRDRINYTLDFIESDTNLHFELVQRLFPDGITEQPSLMDESARAEALNWLARALKNRGRPRDAVEIFRRQLQTEPSQHRKAIGLSNLTNALRLTGRLYEAEKVAREMLAITVESADDFWKGYGAYWVGVVQAGCGLNEESELMLRQAEVIFAGSGDRSSPASMGGLGRTYAHLAQKALWNGNPSLGRALANHSRELAREHGEQRELIFTARLLGAAEGALGNFDCSSRYLLEAFENASLNGYIEEEISALVELGRLYIRKAALHQKEGRIEECKKNLKAAFAYLSEETKRKADDGPFPLLQADFYNSIAELERIEGNRAGAAEAAIRAYYSAWCDGPPHAYHWGLTCAREELVRLGVPEPQPTESQRLLRDPMPELISPLIGDDLRLAESRAHFSRNYLPMMFSAYRYAPTKFIRLIREEWNAVKQIVKDEAAFAKPYFIEIHVGEPCNLNCRYCRGELRTVPKVQRVMDRETLLRLIEGIYELNERAFIRFSGVIGEPLLHPNIVEVFEAVNRHPSLSWGLTTNGLQLDKNGVANALMSSTYVHISVDAANDTTYQTLKGGRRGDLERVLVNIRDLVRSRSEKPPLISPQMPIGTEDRVRIIVSFLIQSDNFSEIPDFVACAEELGVDVVELKMQHLDKRRKMSRDEVEISYDLITKMIDTYDRPRFRVVPVQTKEQALAKIGLGAKAIDFQRCYASQLGLSVTVDPNGSLQSCCQYYQATLGAQGNVCLDSFSNAWSGRERGEILSRDPRDTCVSCSPSDEFINRFVSYIRTQGEGFIDWLEKQI